jgi:hypothetical protein
MKIVKDSDGGVVSVRFPGESIEVHFFPEPGEALLVPCGEAESVPSLVDCAMDSGHPALAPNAEA